MSKYQASTKIDAPADDVFQFVSDPEQMPKYLPTLHDAHREGQDRVRVQGEAAGHPYNQDGWFRTDNRQRTMQWGSDGENRYSGDLQVQDQGDSSYISVHLDFEPNPGQDEEFKRQMGNRDRAIQQGLEDALQSVKNQCEGRGGKVKNAAERQNKAQLF